MILELPRYTYHLLGGPLDGETLISPLSTPVIATPDALYRVTALRDEGFVARFDGLNAWGENAKVLGRVRNAILS